jgi:hypothetical protein
MASTRIKLASNLLLLEAYILSVYFPVLESVLDIFNAHGVIQNPNFLQATQNTNQAFPHFT